jgi:hypothetical protein
MGTILFVLLCLSYLIIIRLSVCVPYFRVNQHPCNPENFRKIPLEQHLLCCFFPSFLFTSDPQQGEIDSGRALSKPGSTDLSANCDTSGRTSSASGDTGEERRRKGNMPPREPLSAHHGVPDRRHAPLFFSFLFFCWDQRFLFQCLRYPSGYISGNPTPFFSHLPQQGPGLFGVVVDGVTYCLGVSFLFVLLPLLVHPSSVVLSNPFPSYTFTLFLVHPPVLFGLRRVITSRRDYPRIIK